MLCACKFRQLLWRSHHLFTSHDTAVIEFYNNKLRFQIASTVNTEQNRTEILFRLKLYSFASFTTYNKQVRVPLCYSTVKLLA